MVQSYVVPSEVQIPGYLRERTPYRMPNTSVTFRDDREKVLDADGRVNCAGAVELHSFVTPAQLVNTCEPTELWIPELAEADRFRTVYDPQIQRGEKEAKGGKKVALLNEANIDGMITDIRGDVFECPELMWNLRFGQVLWVYVEDKRELLIYQGVATRPDTNHRHHAIIRFHKIYRKYASETGAETMEDYNPKREYSLAIFTDDFAGEAHKFYVLNSKGWKVAPGKAHYVASLTNDPHAHARLAKDLMVQCGVLGDRNVEIVQSSLSKNSAKVVLFYTLVRGLQNAFPHVPSESEGYDALLQYLIAFVAELHNVRPNEIGMLSLEKRQKARSETIADQAITWIAYLRLAALTRNRSDWKELLGVIGHPFRHKSFKGDLLGRNNPLWQERGVLAPGKNGALKVISNRNSQQQLIAALSEVVGLDGAAVAA